MLILQFDVLWDALSGLEHLHLFANIKGLNPASIESVWTLQPQTHLSFIKSYLVPDMLSSWGKTEQYQITILLLSEKLNQAFFLLTGY